MNLLFLLIIIIICNLIYFFINYDTKIENYSNQIDNLRELDYLRSKFKPLNCIKPQTIVSQNYNEGDNLVNNTFVEQETLDAINQYPQTDYFIDSLMSGSFKPECCPSVYSTSHGCLCKERSTFDLIVTRGGNRASIPITHY
jgi:hypothetical protein